VGGLKIDSPGDSSLKMSQNLIVFNGHIFSKLVRIGLGNHDKTTEFVCSQKGSPGHSNIERNEIADS